MRHLMKRYGAVRPLMLLAVGLVPGLGWAQATILWEAKSSLSPTLVPAYAGQGSPFPAPVVVAPVAVDEAAEAGRQQRAAALAAAEQAVGRRRALEPALESLRVNGVTQGRLGPRLLVGNQWVGLGEKLSVSYRTQADVQEALRALRALDPEAANTLEQQLRNRQSQLEAQGVTVEGVDLKGQTLRLKTPQGPQEFPLKLETY